MYKKLFVGLTCLVAIFLMTHIADAQEPIKGPWLWMIAPTEANQGGQASTDIDSLDVASGGDVTEDMVAANGAKEGDAVGDYAWTLGTLPDNGDTNVMVVDIGMTEVADFNDVSSYSLIYLVSATAQSGVTLGVSSDDSIKVWLNGEVVHTNAVNRGRGGTPANIDGYQDKIEVNLVEGANLLMVKVSERGGGWGQYVGIDADVTTSPTPPIFHIEGEWLWMIAPTEANQGGANSTDIDSLAVASNDDVTEEDVATNGAAEGDEVGDYAWTLGALPANGDINAMLVELGVTENADFNDVTSYALITLVSEEDVEGAMLGVSSDDSVKVWLNGEEVHNNPVNRGRGGATSFQDSFAVNLVKGDNLLMIKVSERGGGWGMYAGISAPVEAMYKSPAELGTSVEAVGKLLTTWGSLKTK
ncbi:hypothetical protein F4054_18705 [Candidatus Poribacteria bacterium]|nr:hypothetical protein [Candidatus Poribacteria bacterium]MYG06179.1 hypothetical protein [Candidatus Poribacteria bacterium]MYK24275.1 hypothetical protein [Candidatus Poribacteria bacterium]